MVKILRKKEKCLNCGHEMEGHNYCPSCGQLNTDKRVSLRTLLKDFLGDYFTFDSKLVHSVEPLIRRPGQLTEDYNSGKRVRYILPLRLYIFISIMFFFVISIKDSVESAAKVDDSKKVVNSLDTLASALHNDIYGDIGNIKAEEYYAHRLLNKKKTNFTMMSDTTSFFYGTDLYKRMEKNGRYYFTEDHKDEFFSKLVENIPKAMFLLLPLFALILKLLYIRSGIFYIEHLIFALHFHSNAFLYLIIANLVDTGWFTAAVSVLIWFVLYFSIRRVYKQSKLKSFVKILLLQTLYLFCLLITFVLLFLYTLSA